MTKDNPATNVAEVPCPFWFNTLIAINFVLFATPNLLPPIYQKSFKNWIICDERIYISNDFTYYSGDVSSMPNM